MREATHLPRMADFAVWMMAVESCVGLGERNLYERVQRGRVHYLALAGSPVADSIKTLCGPQQEWQGTWSEFLDKLSGNVTEATRRSDNWPGNSQKLSTAVRELVPIFVASDSRLSSMTMWPQRVTIRNTAPPAEAEKTPSQPDAAELRCAGRVPGHAPSRSLGQRVAA